MGSQDARDHHPLPLYVTCNQTRKSPVEKGHADAKCTLMMPETAIPFRQHHAYTVGPSFSYSMWAGDYRVEAEGLGTSVIIWSLSTMPVSLHPSSCLSQVPSSDSVMDKPHHSIHSSSVSLICRFPCFRMTYRADHGQGQQASEIFLREGGNGSPLCGCTTYQLQPRVVLSAGRGDCYPTQ